MREGRSKKVLPSASKKGIGVPLSGTTVKDNPLFPGFSKLSIKFALGFSCLLFFLNYEPVFGFPPVKKPLALAQTPEQSQTVSAQSLPVTFQLPHPGYLSTSFSYFHPGIDIATGLGMPIKPVAKGTVLSTGYNIWGLGLNVEIDHGSGYHSLYAHMGKIYVTPGKQVSENDILGEVGLTGHTSGPHDHLEISLNSKYLDPLKLLPEIRTLPLTEDFATHSAQLVKK